MSLDLDGTLTHWSVGASALYGYAADEVVGKPLKFLFPDQNPADLSAELSRVRGGTEFRGEKRSRKKDGAEVWVDVHTTLMLDGKGDPVGLLGVVQDATERRRLAAELMRQTEMEHHLIAMVSHDLRNPLHAVVLSAALGLKTKPDARMQRYLERIKTSAERGSRLIHDLLDFNGVRHGSALQIVPQPIDLKTVVAEQIEEVLVTRPERDVRISVSGDVTGEWDADRISQVIGNLVTNALQHTTEEALVTVRLVGKAEHVELSVHNEGPPIPSDVAQRLFQPFVRGQVSATTGRSVGLGLFITRAIAEAHGGTIVGRSNETGTTFTITLPRRPTETRTHK